MCIRDSQVVCVDNDAAKVKLLQSGGIPIYEPGLEELVKKNVAAGRLTFTSSTAEGVQKSDVIFIAVPTPPRPDGSVDLSFIERVARDIAAAMTSYKIVVDKSTVPVKTGEKVSETIKRLSLIHIWFEPAIQFVLETKQATILLSEGKPEQKRDFLKKIGSNFHVAEKSLAVEFKKPWNLLAEFNSDLTTSNARQREFSQKSNWRCLSDKVRTFFEENPVV